MFIIRYTSENYAIMNYGVGGFLGLHNDNIPLPQLTMANLGGQLSNHTK